MAKKRLEFFTIGHSTRPLDEFLGLLERAGIELVVDVRTVPRSRTNPQYDRATLPRTLAKRRIAYEQLPALGGLRGKQRDVPPEVNAFWTNDSFHNYADYAMSASFREGMASLRSLGHERRCAVMCAEAVWWRCHRRIIADYLLHERERVFHIMGGDRLEEARMTDAAGPGPRGTLVYPAQPGGESDARRAKDKERREG